MILQQYKELLKLRGVEMEKGKTLQTILKQSGGKETEEEKKIVTEKAMYHFISELEEKVKEIKELNLKISKLQSSPTNMDLVDFIKFQSKQIANYEMSDCDGSYAGIEHKTSFIFDDKEFDMVLNIFWEKANHIEISVTTADDASFLFSEMIYF